MDPCKVRPHYSASLTVDFSESWPCDWERSYLGDEVEFTRKRHDKVLHDFDMTPFISMELLPNDKLYTDKYELRPANAVKSGVYFQEGDVLLAKITPCLENGKLAVARDIPGKWGYATTEVYPLHSERIDSVFLALYLKWPQIRALLTNMMQGTTGRQRLPREALKKLPLPIPPRNEQRAIVQVLETVQRAKEATERVIAATKTLKQSLMRHLFTYGTVSVHDADEVELQVTDMGSFPAHWVIKPLASLCQVIVDCPHSTPTFTESGVRVLKNVNIRDGRMKLTPSFFTDEQHYAERTKRLEPQAGDVVLSREAPIGEACVIPPGMRLCLGQRLMLLRVDPNRLSNQFLVYLMYSKQVRSNLTSLGTGVTTKHVNVGDVKAMQITIPDLDEQKAIVAILKAIDDKLETEDRRLAALTTLFETLLYYLMTGRILVSLA